MSYISKSEDTGHWGSLEEIDTGRYFGFVYFIKNLVTGRKYIGKKQYFLSNGKVKRTVNNRGSTKWNPDHWRDSGWRNYTGSSKDLTKDIVKYGKESFIFVILKQCVSKAQLHYGEIVEQVLRDVICEKLEEDDSQYAYYNKSIAAIKFRPPEYHSEDTKKKLREIFSEKSMQKHSIYITNGVVNKWFNRDKQIPDGWRAGITRRDIGREQTDAEKVSLSKAQARSRVVRMDKMAIKAGYKDYAALIQAVKDRYEGGETCNQIAKAMGITHRPVSRIIKGDSDG